MSQGPAWISQFLMREETGVPKENPQSHVDRIVKKIESSRRDGKSNRGDFLTFVFLMLVNWSYARLGKPAHLSE